MDLELPIVVGMFLGVAGVGYMLGRRGLERRPADTPSTQPASSSTKEEEVEEKPAPRPKAVEAKVEAKAKEEEVEKSPAEAPAEEKKPAVKLASEGAKEIEAKVTERRREAASDPLMKIAYDEDEGDELDLTKVGANATGSGPPTKLRTIYQPPVERIVFDPEAEEAPISEKAQTLFLTHATAQTDPGLRRKRNEDSLLVLPNENLYVVADGMGGHRGGELASKMAIEAMSKSATTQTFEGPPHDHIPLEASELARAIQMANADIQEFVATRKELRGMGTTLVAARFLPTKKRLFIGHVGDSRCYRLRNGVLKVMTADHTMADHGLTGPESAALSRAVGIWATMPIDILLAVPQLDDVYLLCSDGLTKMLPDDTIANVLRSEEDPKIAVERLVFFANAHGGKDNITVVLVRVVPPNFRPRSASRSDA